MQSIHQKHLIATQKDKEKPQKENLYHIFNECWIANIIRKSTFYQHNERQCDGV